MNDQIGHETNTSPAAPQQPQGMSGLKIFGIVVAACVTSTLVALVAVYFYLFHASISPVELSVKEEQVLEQKLGRLDSTQRSRTLHKSRHQPDSGKEITPERYSEADANREIILTERELNGLLATNTDLASTLAIDLSDDLASAKLIIPLDEEMPVLGGKTLKVTAGLELAYRNRNPVVALRGISLWGVPIPNAWLGNMKNVDLVQEFGDQDGFWKAFSDGVDEIEVNDGELRIRLKE
jgi:hypothetical protein